MPLTTPDELVGDYGQDAGHFLHVLDHLFVPAVEKAGYRAVRPVMTGADLIQAEIIRNLEVADLVLVDISRHNPNVFFELGIRTALDRPIALVCDNYTSRLPFDTGILNTHTYDASLAIWTLSTQIDSLVEHIKRSAERSHGSNALWRYFGLTQRGAPPAVDGDPTQAKLDIVLRELAGIQTELSASDPKRRERVAAAPSLGGRPLYPAEHKSFSDSANRLIERAISEGLKVLSYTISPPNKVYMTAANSTEALKDRISGIAADMGLAATIVPSL